MLKATIETRTSLQSLLLVLASLGWMSGDDPARLPENVNIQDQGVLSVLKDPRHKVWRQPSPGIYKVRFETGKGPFIIQVNRTWAPNGADRFYNLVRTGFFNDSRFFRVRAGYIAQFGIPGDPDIAAHWRNNAIPDDPVRQSNLRGFIAFAMTGPNSRTTQIYVNLADNPRLDAEGFAPIGKIVEGMEIVDQLYAGYGEDAGGGMRGGKQDQIFESGNQYLDEKFPRLDRLIRARIVAPGK